MPIDTSQIVNKAWNCAHILRDDGLSYMSYTEQITFLLFLKMADEMTRPMYNRLPPAEQAEILAELIAASPSPTPPRRRSSTPSSAPPASAKPSSNAPSRANSSSKTRPTSPPQRCLLVRNQPQLPLRRPLEIAPWKAETARQRELLGRNATLDRALEKRLPIA